MFAAGACRGCSAWFGGGSYVSGIQGRVGVPENATKVESGFTNLNIVGLWLGVEENMSFGN